MRILAVSNHKGGSGKTTTAVSLAPAFAERGFRVLVVDLDPQGSATDWLAACQASIGLVDFSRGGLRTSDIVVRSTTSGVDLIPASASLVPPIDNATLDTGLAIVRGFARLPDHWDFVLIDTPPSPNYLSLAALAAADAVAIPVTAQAMALPGMASVIESIDRARRQVNRRLDLLGILLCRVTATRHTREVIAKLRAELGPAVLAQSVRETHHISEAFAARQPITVYAPTSPVANDYREVAADMLDRLGDLRSR
jgi:chromosome partitioning protein